MKLIKIGAEWCGPCKTLDKKLEGFNTCPLEKYDVDTEEAEPIVDKYNVRNVPVLVLVDDEKDEVVKKWVGSATIDEINKEIENYKG